MYIAIGVISYFLNSNKSFKDRPLALARGGLFGVLIYLIISPVNMLFRLLRGSKRRRERAVVNASEEEVALYNAGAAANSRGDYKSAIEYFTQAIEINPGFSEAYAGRGTAYSRGGQENSACSDFDKAIELDPNNGLAYYHRALTKFQMGDKRRAISDVNKAKELGLDIDPGFEKLIQ